MVRSNVAGWVFGLAAALASPAVAASAPDGPSPWSGELTLSAGFDYSTGDYGESIDTDIWYVPLSATYLFDRFPWTDYEWDLFELRLTVPYLRIKGPGDFFVDGLGNVAQGRRTEEGLGDVLVRGTYIWLPARGRALPVVELTGRVKIPTADEKRGLGTGRTDYSFQVDLSRSLGRLTPFGSLGYRFLGDPHSFQLQSGFYASLGAGFRLSDRIQAGLLYSFTEASAKSRSDSHELVPYATIKMGSRWSVGPYAVIGLGGRTPDWAAGFSLRWSVPLR